MKTKGQIEADISEAMVRFEVEYMGRGPEETRTYLMEDMVLVRLKGVLTPAEKQLADHADYNEGKGLIKKIRTQLLEKAREMLAVIVQDATGRRLVSLHTDISTKRGERMILFVLDGAVDLQESKQADNSA
jgi:uncharacterized protein YbcI